MTDYALQGRSLNYLVINLPERTYKMCAEAVYVLMGRCRTRAGLRYLDGADLPNLRELRHSPKSHAWCEAYGTGGVFSDERAVKALRKAAGGGGKASAKRVKKRKQ